MISQLVSAFLGASVVATPGYYPELDSDLNTMKKTVVQSLSSTYQGDELVSFEELILNPVIALIEVSRPYIKNNLALRVYVRNYYSLVALSLGECDLEHAAQSDPNITYSLVKPVLKKIVQRKEVTCPKIFLEKKKHCSLVMQKLEESFGKYFDAADLLINHHA